MKHRKHNGTPGEQTNSPWYEKLRKIGRLEEKRQSAEEEYEEWDGRVHRPKTQDQKMAAPAEWSTPDLHIPRSSLPNTMSDRRTHEENKKTKVAKVQGDNNGKGLKLKHKEESRGNPRGGEGKGAQPRQTF